MNKELFLACAGFPVSRQSRTGRKAGSDFEYMGRAGEMAHGTETFKHGGEIYNNKNIQFDFSVNINPLGIPALVKEDLSALISGTAGWNSCLEQYPDQDCTELRETLSVYTGVRADRILCGNGASELIEAAVRAIRPESILLTAPSFSGYRHAAEGAGVRILYHELRREEDFCLTERYLEDLERLGQDGRNPQTFGLSSQSPGLLSQNSGSLSAMAILCNPANPVGNTIEPRLLKRIVEKCSQLRIWLLIDECFLGFLKDEKARTARRYFTTDPGAAKAGAPGGHLTGSRGNDPGFEGNDRGSEGNDPGFEGNEPDIEGNEPYFGDIEPDLKGVGTDFEGIRTDRLLVLDAFTKRFAMPGIRLGYLMAQNTDLLKKIRAQQPEWSVSVLAQKAGLAALKADLPQKRGMTELKADLAQKAGLTALKADFPQKAVPGALESEMPESADNTYMDRARALVAAERKKMKEALQKMGFRVFPGEANYIFFSAGETTGRERPDLQAALLKQGILIRSCENYVGLRKGDYRVAVLSPEKNAALLTALGREKTDTGFNTFHTMEELKKPAEILAVSFGTSYPETRGKTIGAIEKRLAEEFREASVHRCFTSRMIRRKLLERDGLRVDSLEEALLSAKERGMRELIVQPLYMMYGREYGSVAAVLDRLEDGCFEKTAFGKPLLAEERDFRILAEAILRHLPLKEPGTDTAVILMGHGTKPSSDRAEQDPDAVYQRLQKYLRAAGALDYFIATVEGNLRLADILAEVSSDRYRKVVLAPLMITAGDHALHDLAGEGEDSWKNVFLKKGFDVKTDLRGIGEWEEVQGLFAVHVQEACSVKDPGHNNY